MPPVDVGYALRERNRTLSGQMMKSGSYTTVRRRPVGWLHTTLLVVSFAVLGACSSTTAQKPQAPGRIFAGVKAPPAAATLRAELAATPLADLLRELERDDPVTFARIDRRNPRRVIRAVEVIRLTGKPFSVQRAAWRARSDGCPPALAKAVPEPARGAAAFGLARAPDDLRQRIDARVDQMFADGLVEETRRLLAQGLAQNPTARQAIGYRQVLEHLRGERALPATVALVKTRTRQFAKRQMTWFRRQMQIQWVTVAPEESPERIARLVLALRAGLTVANSGLNCHCR